MNPRRRDFMAVVALVPVGLVVLFFALPILGVVVRAPWGRPQAFVSGEVGAALFLSIVCALGAALLSGVLGLPLAVWLAARDSRLRRVVRVLVTLPLVMPPVVVGAALLTAFGRRGLVGEPLHDWLGLVLPFSPVGVVIAEVYVAMPFFVLAAEAGLRAFDSRYTAVAATLGASPLLRFRRVVLPMLGPTLLTALVVAWARALGEFGATVTFAGSLEGATRTMPLAIAAALERDMDAALAMSLVLIAVSAAILFGLRERWLPARRMR